MVSAISGVPVAAFVTVSDVPGVPAVAKVSAVAAVPLMLSIS
jgi:hypothetical protein